MERTVPAGESDTLGGKLVKVGRRDRAVIASKAGAVADGARLAISHVVLRASGQFSVGTGRKNVGFALGVRARRRG